MLHRPVALRAHEVHKRLQHARRILRLLRPTRHTLARAGELARKFSLGVCQTGKQSLPSRQRRSWTQVPKLQQATCEAIRSGRGPIDLSLTQTLTFILEPKWLRMSTLVHSHEHGDQEASGSESTAQRKCVKLFQKSSISPRIQHPALHRQHPDRGSDGQIRGRKGNDAP